MINTNEFSMTFLDKIYSRAPVVIAEAGVNHNGSVIRAKQLVDAAVRSGADYVKFQLFDPDELASYSVPKATYQKKNVDNEDTQQQMLRKLTLSLEDYKLLKDYCSECNIGFAVTAFDPCSLAFIVSLGVDFVKIPSGEMLNPWLLQAAVESGLPIVLSTGMSSFDDIERAIELLKRYGFDLARLVLLHCVSNYPALPGELNLLSICSLVDRFGVAVGYSDHSLGIYAPIAAVALGALVVEKHFTISRTDSGPDHAASLTPDELCSLISSLRDLSIALGSSEKPVNSSEVEIKKVVVRKLIARKSIDEGEIFNLENIYATRSADGAPIGQAEEFLGRRCSRRLVAGQPIVKDCILQD